jgi:GMP synthase (glutamine-hydrolysing)
MKTALTIRHVAFEDLGTLEPALLEAGFQLQFRDAGVDDLSAIDPQGPDLLIVLGGPIGVYEQRDYPFLTDEIDLLQRRLAGDLPILGICLGAQLLAAALGARVYPGNTGKEIGWGKLLPGERAPDHSFMLPLLDEGVEVLHWHGDTFDLPTGAAHLAASDRYVNQAFAWGRSGLGLQFHPEVTAQGLERWYIGHAGEIAGQTAIDTAMLREETRRKAPRLEVAARQFWSLWLESIENR